MGRAAEAAVGNSSPNRTRYDVVIVGAGPAGSALARLLARAGIDVLALDKARFPRRQPCGGLISPKGAGLIADIYGPEVLPRLRRAESTECRVFYEGALTAHVKGCAPMVVIDRAEMDAAFVSIARDAGCEISESSQVVGIDPAHSAVELASGRRVSGAVLVGADGAESVVRRAVCRGRVAGPRRTGFGLVADVPLERVRAEEREAFSTCLHLHFGLIPWGYGWVFPKGDRVCLGIGAPIAKAASFREPFKRLLELTCTNGAGERVDAAGRRIPFANFTRRPGRRSVLLVGDAAGFVEPVTGEGIPFALESAVLAAEAIGQSLAAGRPPDAGRLYTDKCRRALLPMLRAARRAAYLFFPRPLLARIVPAFGRHPEFVRWYVDIVAGRLTYGEYLRRVFRTVWASRCPWRQFQSGAHGGGS